MNIVFYGYWRSSASYRVRIALGAKGIAYTYKPVNILAGEQKSAEYLARAPLGHVPTLEVDGTAFVESVAILELLEDLKPEPALYPRDATTRAHVRAMVETINSGTQPLHNLVVLNRFPEPERKAWTQHFIARGLAAFERLLEAHSEKRGPHCMGTQFTAADVLLVPQMYAARRFDVDLAPLPLCVAADAKARELPFVQAAAPELQADAPKTT
jgi:maleylacetoacetate isomerase